MHDLLRPIKRDGLDLAALPEEGLQLLVVQEAVGRGVLQLQNRTAVRAPAAQGPQSRADHRCGSGVRGSDTSDFYPGTSINNKYVLNKG